ncbi:MAG: phosphatase PAP2 family protein [Geodermatophilaceae bacterium]
MLTVSVAAIALLGTGLVSVTEDVLDTEELVRADSPISRYLLEHRERWLTTSMDVITQLGSAVVLVPVLIALGLVARRSQGTWRPAVFLAATLGGASTISALIKLMVARPRPSSGALIEAIGYAFPSGHSTAAAAGWLAAALVAGLLTRSSALRLSLLAGALLIIVLVGISRVYLGVHAATDVLGGWALGGLWVVLVLTARSLLTARRGASDGALV